MFESTHHSDVADKTAETLTSSVPERLTQDTDIAGQSVPARPALKLVGGTLRLAQPCEAMPEEWLLSITALLDWLDIRMEFVPPRPPQGLKEVVDWARGETAVPAAPLFAPWRGWSPVAFQNDSAQNLPRGDWVGSYLLDHTAGRSSQQARLDVLLMSPHPAACVHEADCNAQLPRLKLLKTMISAARSESRKKVAIIVHARSRNAMIGQMLLVDRSLTREGIEIDIVSVEDALGDMMRSAGRWDAIIVMPDLRSIVFAMLAHTSGISGPWPMLWHGRNLCVVGSEVLANGALPIPLDAPLLVKSLALAAFHSGLGHGARRLHEAAAQLWLRGLTTPGRSSIAPYANEVSDAEFVRLIGSGAGISGRIVPGWRAVGTPEGPAVTTQAVKLHIVSPV